MSKFLGQHFLKNNSVIQKIIAAIEPRAGETIIEIGPGHGELTIPLAAQAQKAGAKIIAVEKDAKLAAALQSKLEALQIENVTVVNEDILEFLKTVRDPFKLVGNIPYYVTGYLLRMLGEPAKDNRPSATPERAVFMLQKEVAERICAVPPRMNRLAASVQFWAQPKIIARVPRADFSPPPEVDSAVLSLETIRTRSAAADASKPYYAAMRTLFAQPRKTVLNNLASEATNKQSATELLQRLGIDPKLRPQNLTIENIVQIAEHFSSVHK